MKETTGNRTEEVLDGGEEVVTEKLSSEHWERVGELAELLVNNGLTELELRCGEEVIRLSRGVAVSMPVLPQPVQQTLPGPATAGGASVGGQEEGRDEHLIPIVAPMTGVFYAAPSPDDPPFVKVGDIVEAGDTVCLLEAMKIFNEIIADSRGRVAQVPAANGDLVKTGQPLILLEAL